MSEFSFAFGRSGQVRRRRRFSSANDKPLADDTISKNEVTAPRDVEISDHEEGRPVVRKVDVISEMNAPSSTSGAPPLSDSCRNPENVLNDRSGYAVVQRKYVSGPKSSQIARLIERRRKERGSKPMEEDVAFKLDISECANETQEDDYARVPVESFGTSLLTSMGWDGKMEEQVERVQSPRPRLPLAGLGMRPSKIDKHEEVVPVKSDDVETQLDMDGKTRQQQTDWYSEQDGRRRKRPSRFLASVSNSVHSANKQMTEHSAPNQETEHIGGCQRDRPFEMEDLGLGVEHTRAYHSRKSFDGNKRFRHKK